MATQKIETGLIADLAVTTAKLADNSVTAAKIAAGSLDDQVKGISSSADAVAITIDSSENVGIGTDSPSGYRLNVSKGSTGNIAQITDGIAQTFIFRSDSNTLYAGNANNFSLAFVTNNTEKMTIDSSGNVGIGTDSPNQMLELSANNGAGAINVLRFNDSDTTVAGGQTTGRIEFSENDGGNITVSAFLEVETVATSGGGIMTFGTGTAGVTADEKMRIDSSGNVGIGTSSPNFKLHLKDGTSTAVYQQFSNDTTGNTSSDGTVLGIDADGDFLINNLESKTIKLFTADTERMRIDSSGNLLVGVTGTSSAVAGTVIYGGSLKGVITHTYAGRPLYINRLSSDGDIIELAKDGSTVGRIGANSGDIYIASTGTYSAGLMFEGSSGAQDIRPCSNTGALLDGAVDLGDSSARFKDLYLSGGTYLGGTGSANKLDDYEEGTWTPSISFSGGTTGQSYVRQQGIYIKIGKMVYVQGHLYFSNKGSSTGHATLTGLPFAISPVASGAFTPIGDRGNLNTGGEPVSVYLHSGGTTATLYHAGFDGGANNDVTYAQFNNSTEIDVNFVYRTT